MAQVFEARFASFCTLCEKRILPGDEACYADDEVVHADCAEDEGYEVTRA